MPAFVPVEESSSAAAVLLLAVIQGLTEFLPVSSSGHLVLARISMDLRDAGLALDVALHLGTLVAVVWAYRSELFQILVEVRGGNTRMVLWLALATVPIGVVGLSVRHLIERAAQNSVVAGTGLLVTAAVLLLGERSRYAAEGTSAQDSSASQGSVPGAGQGPTYGRPSWADAIWLGLAQALAVVPGISRSGTTVAVGLMRKQSSEQAARLSFLMSIPAVAGAALVELPGAAREGIEGLSGGLVLTAIALSAFVGWAALRTLLLVLRRGALRWFAGYCALLGSAALLFAR
ncbi:MAG: undecaprenyl-diphosphate phosphatase [Planctomycetota bacterium]